MVPKGETGGKKALALKKLASRGAGVEMLAMVCSGACPRIEAFSALGQKTVARALAACGRDSQGQGRELCLAYILIWEALGGKGGTRLAPAQKEWDKQRAGILRESGAFAFSAQCAAFGHGPWSAMEDAERARALDALEALDKRALARPAAPYWERLDLGKAPAGLALACESLRAGPQASKLLARSAGEHLGEQMAWALACKALREGKGAMALEFADNFFGRFGSAGYPGAAAAQQAAQLWPCFAARAQRADETDWRAWLDLGEMFEKRLGGALDAENMWNSGFALALAHSGSAYGSHGWDRACGLARRMGRLGRSVPPAAQMGAKGEPLARRASEEGAWARLVSANEEGLLGRLGAAPGLARRGGI